MKPSANVGWVVLGSVIFLLFGLLNKGVLVGSTVENIGHVSGTTQPVYRRTCRYLSLNGIERRIGAPRLSEGGPCALIK